MSTEPSNLQSPISNPRSPCPICGGTGYLREDVPVGHPRFGKLTPCRCTQAVLEERQLADLRAIGNLDALARYTFDSFKPDGVGIVDEAVRINLRRAYETARTYADNPQGWLVLLGGYGCGKTHLAAAIANQQVVQGRLALFVVVPDLLDHLRATYSPQSPVRYDERFDQVRNTPLLILDDLGTQSSTEWAQEKLFQIFNYRYNTRLPTVVTSNRELGTIDIRVRSRLFDSELVQICPIVAPDFRGTVTERVSDLSSLSLHGNQTFENFSLREEELSAELVENLKRALARTREYAKNPVGWLLLTGSYGCGKTHLAAAIANEMTRHGHLALFIVVPDLLDHLRATYAPNSAISYDKRLDDIRTAPLLILDDLGTHSATPWAQEKLYQIFNYRYSAGLPTVVTAAYDKDLKIDERIKSRLFDRRLCTRFEIGAPSFRGPEGRPDSSTGTLRRNEGKPYRKRGSS